MSMSLNQLRSLAGKPFELLLEMDRLTRAGIAGQTEEEIEQEWVGIGFRLSGERFLVDRRQVREVMTYPARITRVPGSKAWVAGLASVRLMRLMCSGRLDPTFVLKALQGGADAVLITGCHPGECHYLEQNYKALRRHLLLRRTLKQFGVEPERVRLVWASAAEGVRLANEINRMVEEIRALGPLNWRGVVNANGDHPVELEQELQEATA